MYGLAKINGDVDDQVCKGAFTNVGGTMPLMPVFLNEVFHKNGNLVFSIRRKQKGWRGLPPAFLGQIRIYWTCWIPANTQPRLLSVGLVMCQISSNGAGAAPFSSLIRPVKRMLTT